MKNNLKLIRNQFIFLLTATLLLPACKKDKAIPPENAWQEYQNLQWIEKVILDGRLFSDSLIFMGTDFYLVLRETNSPASIAIRRPLAGSKTWGVWERPLIHRNIIIANYNESEGIMISTNLWSNQYSDTLWLDMKKYDSRFDKIRTMTNGLNGTFISNDRDQLLVQYLRKAADDSMSIMILDIDFNELKNRGSNAFRAKIIDLPENGWLRNWHVFGDNYFINMNKGTYLLKPSGILTKVINEGWTMRMFHAKLDQAQANPYIFAFVPGSNNLLFSKDNGLTWETFNNNLNIANSDNIFTNIDGEVIGFLESNLYHLQLSQSQVNLKKLNNKGLEGKFITSVNKLKGKYYVSTLTGLFTKDEADFFEYVD